MPPDSSDDSINDLTLRLKIFSSLLARGYLVHYLLNKGTLSKQGQMLAVPLSHSQLIDSDGEILR